MNTDFLYQNAFKFFLFSFIQYNLTTERFIHHKKKLMRYIFFTLTFIFIVSATQAQITITGMLKDTTNEAVSSATVMLLNPKDSTLANFTSSDSKGNFAFKNVRKTNYILKISHISFMPREFFIAPMEEKEINMGAIEMKQIASFLMEIVIREAKAPIFIRGDTVEYDARTFKVPPGSTVEDLLRKLPGIDVDAEGNISTMGKDVKTVYVDGKAFFGNDPKTVTQNLDAQAISKVQVFNEKSEQEKITGLSDGSQQKVMNLELKDEYKKGYFGKASIGYGWGANAPHRWLAKGNFNWFTDKQQLSFIGYGNNLNQTNLDWSDMSEFRGQSMQSGNDNGDFGFNSGSGRMFRTFSSYGFDGIGFSNNGGGGVNYNYYNKKLKFNAGYLYTLNQTFSDVFSKRETFLEDSTFWRIDSTSNENLRQNHNFSTRFEYQIDSSNNIVVRVNLGYLPTKRSYLTDQLFQTSELIDINHLAIDNKYKNNNWNFDVLTIYDHKFKKKGRTFAFSGFYNYKDGYNFEDINNLNEFFEANPSDKIKYWVKNEKASEEHTVKSSLLYVEPLGKRFSLLGFYNFRNTKNYNHNFSTDPQQSYSYIDSLELEYENNTLYNRVGASANYGHNGITFTLGGAYQSLILNAICRRPPGIEKLDIPSYHNFIPYFSTYLQLPKNMHVDASYSYSVKEPDVSYLFPMPDLSNTLYRILGNPNLIPERFHEMDASFYLWNSASMVNLNFNVNAKLYTNQIVYNQNIDYVIDQGFVTTAVPSNVAGGNNVSSYIWTNFPIVKTILTMSLSVNGSLSDSPVFINQEENKTNSKRYGAYLRLNLTVKQRLTFTVGANVSQNFTQYSIQTDRNQSYINYGANVNGKWQVLKKSYLEGTYSFTNYSNAKLDFYQNIHTLNLSVRQVIGKKNQWEMRLAAMDILNNNQYINQIARINYIEYRTAPTLARYFLLTVSYNIKGFEVKNTGSRNVIIM